MGDLLQEEPENNEIGTEGGKIKKNKSKLLPIILLGIIILLLAGGVIYYFVIYNSPTNMFKRLAEKPIGYLQKSLDTEDYKTIDTSVKLDLEVEPENGEMIDEDILELINAIQLTLGAQLDKENKKIAINMDSNYKGEELLDAEVYSNIQDKESYLYVNSIFNHYLEVDMEDEYYDELEESLESTVSNDEKISFNQAFRIIKKEVKDVVKKEYCDSQKEEIEIDGKKVKATKNTLTMTTKQMQNELITVLTNLKDNDKFIECFEEKDEAKSNLEDAISELKQLKGSDKDTITINIYTTGLIQKIVRTDFILSTEGNGKVTFEIKKAKDTSYEFKVYMDAMEKSVTAHAELITGMININEKNKNEASLEIEMQIIELGKIKIALESSYKVNEEIKMPEVTNSVKLDELTQEDMNKMYENLRNTKLYELIEKFTGEGFDNSLLDSAQQTVENNESLSISQNNKLSTSSNEIVTYDNRYKIQFGVPQGYESNYASDNYKTFDKDEVSITISTDIGDMTEYFDSLESTKKYFEETGNYQDITISDLETKQINDKTFYSKTLKYRYVTTYSDLEFSKRYICTPISNDIIVTIEIDEDTNISDEELNQFLNITIQKQ